MHQCLQLKMGPLKQLERISYSTVRSDNLPWNGTSIHIHQGSWNSSRVRCTDRVASLRLTLFVRSCFAIWLARISRSSTPGSRSYVDLARLPPCMFALKPHIQRVKTAMNCTSEPTNEFWINQTRKTMGSDGAIHTEECWNRCGAVVIS